MTINSPAAMIWAMYIVAAEKMGVPRAQLAGTLQNDILKEFIAQKEYIFPPAPSLKLVTDTVEFGTREMPRWNTISISGYHIREAGSTAVQELAFTIADGIAYVEDALARGLRFDDFAPRLSFFFNSHNDFFEEIAKFRAARRIWYKLCRERFGAENERSTWMRFHTQTAGVSLTAQQPLNNLTRVAIQALAGVLGGTQSPPHRCVRRGVGRPIGGGRPPRPAPAADPGRGVRRRRTRSTRSAGSYFVETLTNQTEQAAWHYIAPHRRDGRHGARARGRLPAGRDRRCGLRPAARARGARARDRRRHEVRRSERGAPHPAARDQRRSRSAATSTGWLRVRAERDADAHATRDDPPRGRGPAPATSTSCRRSSPRSRRTPPSARCAASCVASYGEYREPLAV